MWLTSNHMIGSGNYWDKSSSWFMKILKLPSFYSGNFKIFKNALGQLIPKNALGQLIPNRPLKRTVTSTNGTMKTLLHVTTGEQYIK